MTKYPSAAAGARSRLESRFSTVKATAEDLYFIVDGRARVVNYSLSGREVTFDDRGGGAYFGELAALDGEPRSANVVALEETVVAILSQEGFHHMLMTYPQVAVRILKNLAKIVHISTDRIMDLSTLGANNRVHGIAASRHAQRR